MTNEHHTVTYTGVTSDLISRVTEHKQKKYPRSFTARYNISKLIYFEFFWPIDQAIDMEKRIKKWKTAWKFNLAKTINPDLIDLYDKIAEADQDSGDSATSAE